MKLFEEQNLDNYDELMKNCLKSESVECVKILKKMAKNHVFSEEVVQAARNTGNLEILEMFGVLDIVIEEEKNKLYRRVTRKETQDIRGKYEALLLFINPIFILINTVQKFKILIFIINLKKLYTINIKIKIIL